MYQSALCHPVSANSLEDSGALQGDAGRYLAYHVLMPSQAAKRLICQRWSPNNSSLPICPLNNSSPVICCYHQVLIYSMWIIFPNIEKFVDYLKSNKSHMAMKLNNWLQEIQSVTKTKITWRFHSVPSILLMITQIMQRINSFSVDCHLTLHFNRPLTCLFSNETATSVHNYIKICRDKLLGPNLSHVLHFLSKPIIKLWLIMFLISTIPMVPQMFISFLILC